MKTTGRYCFVEDPYDIDHVINESVDKTKEFVTNLTDMANSKEDAKKILVAISTTIIEELGNI